jgi:hypothetical protein
MDIKKSQQYNISSSKFKMLSTNAGVGAVITTKWGGFVMPLCISEWEFIKMLTDSINNPAHSQYTLQQYQEDAGAEVVDDERFVKFLQFKKGFTGLKCFAAIPHVSLSGANYINYKEHPLYKEQEAKNKSLHEKMFYIPAIDFPKWFISAKSELKRIDDWYHIWMKEEFVLNGHKCRHNDGKDEFFAPPRDPHGPTRRKFSDKERLNDSTIYKTLTPVPLVLICENGHISDIDWYKYFCARLDGHKMDDEGGFDLFGYPCDNHCKGSQDHSLKWVQNRNQSESWGTLKCEHCGNSVSLAGIMNLKVFCRGEKPWEPEGGQNWVPSHEKCTKAGGRTVMQVAMVTSNSIYYAYTQNSLYVPLSWTSYGGTVVVQGDAMEYLEELKNIYVRKLKKNPDLTKEDFLKEIGYLVTSAAQQGYDIDDAEAEAISNDFLGITNDVDVVKTYRLEEFKIFVSNDKTPEVDKKFDFNDIDMDAFENALLKDKFLKIKQVPTLAITSTQLGFGRVKMPSPKLVDGQVVYSNEQIRPIYTGNINDVKVLPANQIYGEGLFFAFNPEKIEAWVKQYRLDEYYRVSLEYKSLGEFLNSEMEMYGRAKFYLLHTFSHILMKELEFSCGYPTASLSERLYYSEEMCGVLIYTADGAEGSMGGLVWQGQPYLIEKIILSALQRATDCSADPLCWENSDGLNKAACFSCAMVSETSCEQQNLGLDRRALVDPVFGFFKELI